MTDTIKELKAKAASCAQRYSHMGVDPKPILALIEVAEEMEEALRGLDCDAGPMRGVKGGHEAYCFRCSALAKMKAFREGR